MASSVLGGNASVIPILKEVCIPGLGRLSMARYGRTSFGQSVVSVGGKAPKQAGTKRIHFVLEPLEAAV